MFRLRRLWIVLTSVRAAIVLLCVLAISAVIGGVVPQYGNNPMADAIHRSYGVVLYWIIRLFSLGDVFHAWWFIMLLSLFFLNLICCTVRRLRFTMRYRIKSCPRQVALWESANAMSIMVSGFPIDQEELEKKLLQLLKRKRLGVVKNGDQIIASRWRFGYLAPDVVHLGVLAILVGVFLGVFRFNGQFYVREEELGQVFRGCKGDETLGCLANVPFDIRIDDFGAEVYPGTGTYSGFWTLATVIENGVEIRRHRIELNRPLTYRGISFYQSLYGYYLDAAEIKLLVVDWNRRSPLGLFSLRVGERVQLPGTEDFVFFVQFFTSLAVKLDGTLINVNTPTPQNPAAVLFIFHGQGENETLVGSTMVFANRPTPHTDPSIPYAFYLESYYVPRYVGLTYSCDPGYPVVWAGFVIVMLGLLGGLYFRPRRVWVVPDFPNGRVLLLVERLRRADNQSWFQEIARALGEELKGGG